MKLTPKETKTMNLQAYNRDGIEIVIDNTTGEAYASQRAVARMCEVNESTIRTFIGARNLAAKTAEVLTPGGVQGARLLNEDAIVQCLFKYNTNH